MRRIALLLFLSALTSCKFGSSSSSVVKEEAPATETPAAATSDATPADACAAVCTDVQRDYTGSPADEGAAKWSACFSCRCKTALGRLPPPEETRCSTFSGPLARYKAVRGEAGRVSGIQVIGPNGTASDKADCLNGGNAAAGCDLQSRFKRLTYDDGNLEFQMMCRKPLATSDGFYEYLIIGHNQRNGATCFWQARSETFNGEDTVQMDLTGANDTPENRRAYAQTFHTLTAGPSTCTDCHANDAFLWSPYFDSVHVTGQAEPQPLWGIAQVQADPMTASRIATDRKYFQVVADQAAPQEVNPGQDLTAAGQPLENACGDCHRVVKTSGYCSMAMRAMGANGLSLDGATAIEHARRYTYWMPPRNWTVNRFDDTRTLLQNACR